MSMLRLSHPNGDNQTLLRAMLDDLRVNGQGERQTPTYLHGVKKFPHCATIGNRIACVFILRPVRVGKDAAAVVVVVVRGLGMEVLTSRRYEGFERRNSKRGDLDEGPV